MLSTLPQATNVKLPDSWKEVVKAAFLYAITPSTTLGTKFVFVGRWGEDERKMAQSYGDLKAYVIKEISEFIELDLFDGADKAQLIDNLEGELRTKMIFQNEWSGLIPESNLTEIKEIIRFALLHYYDVFTFSKFLQYLRSLEFKNSR